MCLGIADSIFGVSPGELNVTMLPWYFDYMDEGASVKVWISSRSRCLAATEKLPGAAKQQKRQQQQQSQQQQQQQQQPQQPQHSKNKNKSSKSSSRKGLVAKATTEEKEATTLCNNKNGGSSNNNKNNNNKSSRRRKRINSSSRIASAKTGLIERLWSSTTFFPPFLLFPQTIVHYGQVVESGPRHFRRFDLGEEENVEAYGTEEPPE